jgi:hypothetical protein
MSNINMSDLLSQNTSKHPGLYCSLPNLDFYPTLPPLTEQLPDMQRRPSIENLLPAVDDDEQLRKNIASMNEKIIPPAQNKMIKRQWSMGPQEGTYGAENDRLFREIIFSPPLTDNLQPQKLKNNQQVEHPAGGTTEVVIGKLLENEDL